jgi:CheY-like chemotaxis protein
MSPSLHAILVEPDESRAEMLTAILSVLGIEVTRAADLPRASTLLSQLQPELLVVGAHPAIAPSLLPWLSALLALTPLLTLLYAEERPLLDLIAQMLPPGVMTLLWPCSQGELAFLLAPLRNRS